ncbi:MAG: CorA family divalent cation transporter [bacterium]|nr:CorA family divalent cation transporter [bacterium]
MTIIKGKTTWVDVFKPNQDDINQLKRFGKFHHLILEELLSHSARARVEEHEGYIYLAHHVPVYDPETKTSRRAEIDFLITSNTIITVRYEPLEQIDLFLQELLRDKKLQGEILSQPSYVLLHQIMENAMGFALRQLRHIEERVGFISKEIFLRHGALLETISYVKRDILDYRLIVRPHEELFISLVEVGERFWGKKAIVYLNNLSGENLRVFQRLENYFAIIESLEKTNSQLLNVATNNIIKRFTILAFLFSIPLFFIFAMSVPYIDAIINTPTKFWAIFLLIIALLSWLLYAFKKKKLL